MGTKNGCISSAYYTVSAPAIPMLADIIPMGLLRAERMEIYKAKLVGYFRENTITTKIEEGGWRDFSRT